MNYKKLKKTLVYASEHREKILGENSAILSIVVSEDKDRVLVMVNGVGEYIDKALYIMAKEHERLASAFIETAEMIKAEMAKLN